MARAILYDSTLCIGCRECEKGCAAKWGLPYDDNIGKEEKLSAHMHCNEPTCASVCPVGAFTKTAFGPVVYDADKCMGCRYCMAACPFQVPTYEWDKPLSPRVRKCDMCYERQSAGKDTACAEACPVQATICGDRDALIAEARKRLAAKPADYYQKIYGLEEVGGTSVLMLSAVPFEQIGLKTNLPHSALPPLTMNVLGLIPNIVSAGGVLLGGIFWLTHRKNEVAKAENGNDNGRKH